MVTYLTLSCMLLIIFVCQLAQVSSPPDFYNECPIILDSYVTDIFKQIFPLSTIVKNPGKFGLCGLSKLTLEVGLMDCQKLSGFNQK